MAVTLQVPEYTVEREVTVPPRTTALIVVDMQNDFVKPGGALVVETAAATIPAIQRLLTLARAKGMKVFFTQDTHEEGDIEFPIWGPHVLRGTWGWQIVDELAPRPGERVIEKLRYDGFFGTPLDHELRLAGIQSVIVCGTVANICVLHTAGSVDFSVGVMWHGHESEASPARPASTRCRSSSLSLLPRWWARDSSPGITVGGRSRRRRRSRRPRTSSYAA